MATIVYRQGRPKPWLAQIKRKGYPVYSRAFALEADAKRWARKEELTIDETGRPFTIKQYERITVGSLCKRYLEEISPGKASYQTDKAVLTNIDRYSIALKSIATVSTQDAAGYRNERLGETTHYVKDPHVHYLKREYIPTSKPISPSTVRREINTLQHVSEIARMEWGYVNIRNPFHRLRIKGSQPRRNRRLMPGGLDRLLKATDGCRANKEYVKLAINLAVYTGLRLQEIFNLTLEDIGLVFGDESKASEQLRKRRITIRKSKTDYQTGVKGRTIVMSIETFWLVSAILLRKLIDNSKSKQFELELLPMTKEAFKRQWLGVVRMAGIEDLTFHDLRHEAGSRFDELGLTKAEHDLIMGHKSRDIASLYIHADLKRIQDKFDKKWYDVAKTKKDREAFGLTLLGDEIDGPSIMDKVQAKKKGR